MFGGRDCDEVIAALRAEHAACRRRLELESCPALERVALALTKDWPTMYRVDAMVKVTDEHPHLKEVETMIANHRANLKVNNRGLTAN